MNESKWFSKFTRVRRDRYGERSLSRPMKDAPMSVSATS